MDREGGQLFPAVEEGDLDVEVVLDQLDGGGDGSAGSEQIVDDKDFLAGPKGIGVDPRSFVPPFQRIDRFPECCAIGQQRRDILELDSSPWKIGNIPKVLSKVFGHISRIPPNINGLR